MTEFEKLRNLWYKSIKDNEPTKLTEQEIEKYVNFTVTAGEYHIKEELRWLISVLQNHNCNDALDSVKDVAQQWEEQ